MHYRGGLLARVEANIKGKEEPQPVGVLQVLFYSFTFIGFHFQLDLCLLLVRLTTAHYQRQKGREGGWIDR